MLSHLRFRGVLIQNLDDQFSPQRFVCQFHLSCSPLKYKNLIKSLSPETVPLGQLRL